MVILGIDTSTKFLCIGVLKKSKVYEYRLDSGRLHSTLLLPSIERILKSLKINPKEIDYLAVGLGPGSFTGIRIGVSTVKGLAAALGKKAFGFSSLDIIAYNAARINGGYKYVLPLLDARRGLIYTSLYRKRANNLKRIMPYKLISISKVIKSVPEKTIFLGEALRLYKRELVLNVEQARFLDDEFSYPKGTDIIKIALERLEKAKSSKTNKLEPIYLYPKECQIRKKESR